MKKFVAIALVAAMTLSMAACGSQPAPAPAAAPEPAPAAEAAPAEAPEAAPEEAPASAFKVAMVTDVGGVNDQSFNQSAWEGLQKLQADTGIEVSYLESQQETNYGPNLDKHVESGAQLIWGIGFMMGDAMLNAAKINPDIEFGIVDNAYDEIPSNLTCAVFKAQEPSFLVGYMAGKTTKTNKVGFIGGIAGDIIGQFEYGYRAGVATAAKEDGKTIDVEIQYAESFTDDAKGKAIATAMYTNGCDIIFHAAGGVGMGLIEAAKEMNKLAIGVDRDQAYLAPDNVMTSALKLVGAAMYEISVKISEGEKTGGSVIPFGLKEGACGVPPYEGSTAKLVEKEVYDKTMELQAKVISGEIVVPVDQETFDAYVQ